MDETFQTKTDIEEMLEAEGIHPRKRWGQHFMIDGNNLRRLIESAELTKDDAVFEVGPGTGAVTEHLVRLVGKVLAVEVDPKLGDIVSRRLKSADNFSLIRGDVFTNKHRIAENVLTELNRLRAECSGRLMMVANLPYDIATPLLMELILGPCQIDGFRFTVQKEVGDRIVASERTKEYGPVSIVIQAACKPRRLGHLPPTIFWPRPEVESTMMQVDLKPNPFDSVEALNRFSQLVHKGFAHRRKILRHNIAHALGKERCAELESLYDFSRRAEEVSVREWISIGQQVESTRSA